MKKVFSVEDLAKTDFEIAVKLQIPNANPFATLRDINQRALALGHKAFIKLIELTDAESDEDYQNFIENLGVENSLYFKTMVSENAEKCDIVAARKRFFETLGPRETASQLYSFFSSLGAKKEQDAA